MANTILTPDEITREALFLLHNNMALVNNCNRSYDDRFAQTGAKVGDTIRILKPAQFSVGTTADITSTIQDYTEEYDSLTTATLRNVAISFSTQELTLKIQDFSERILAPAMARLASEIDLVGCQTVISSAYNEVGTPGTTPGTSKVWLDAGAVMDSYAAPRDKRRAAILSPAANAETVEGLKGLLNSSPDVSKQYKSGMMSDALGLKFEMDQNVSTITTGTRASYQTNMGSAPTAGAASITVDTGTGTIALGEVFTIAGIYECNPETKVSTGRLKQFVATTAYGSTTTTITVSPAIYTSGARQNVVNTNASSTWDNLALTFRGSASQTYPVNFALHKDSMILATVDMEDVSQFGAWGARMTQDGISMRIARQYNVNTDAMPCRIDVLFGWKAIRPEHICRVSG